MPNGWAHAVQDLIAFGRPYLERHQQKDAPAKTLGAGHRKINHEWYNLYGHEWTHDDLFPQVIMDFFRNLRQKKTVNILRSKWSG